MTPPNPTRTGPIRHDPLVQVWRWQIAACSEPVALSWALPVADGVLAALMETGWVLRGSRHLPLCLHGPKNPRATGWSHAHAFILPEDADADGGLDHITIAASMGLDPAALRLLVATGRVNLTNGAALDLVAECMGPLGHAGHAGPARKWISRTAYVPPNDHGKAGAKDAANQLRYEIRKRTDPARLSRAPAQLSHIVLGDHTLVPDIFHLTSENGEARPSSDAFFFQLEFEAPQSGPLAFGWNCHRGLGQFVPDE
jgi:CRISPR-associated protein Csb2